MKLAQTATLLIFAIAHFSYLEAASKPRRTAPPSDNSGSSKPEETSGYPGTDKDYNMLGIQSLPDKGIMLRRMDLEKDWDKEYPFLKDGKLDNRRTLPYDLKEQGLCITLKMQNKFDALNENATPASFSWTKDAGADGVFQADAAVRVDFWIPGLYDPKGAEVSLAFGYEIHRSDVKGKETDLQSYHMSIPFVPKTITQYIPFIKDADQVFQLHVSYNRDELSGEDGFDIETDYRPTFVLPGASKEGYGLWVGARCAFDGKPIDPGTMPKSCYYAIEPKVGISYGDKYSLGSPIANLDQQLVASYQAGVKIGTPIGTGGKAVLMEASYTFKGGNALTESQSFLYHEAKLHFQAARGASPVSIDFTYQKGQDGFAAADIDRFTVGLGVQF